MEFWEDLMLKWGVNVWLERGRAVVVAGMFFNYVCLEISSYCMYIYNYIYTCVCYRKIWLLQAFLCFPLPYSIPSTWDFFSVDHCWVTTVNEYREVLVHLSHNVKSRKHKDYHSICSFRNYPFNVSITSLQTLSSSSSSGEGIGWHFTDHHPHYHHQSQRSILHCDILNPQFLHIFLLL